MSRKVRNDALAEIRAMVEQEREAQKNQMSRRFFKLSAVALNDRFGFGAMRIERFFNEIEQLILSAQEDEIFWEHIDKQVIDRLGFDFERDYTR